MGAEREDTDPNPKRVGTEPGLGKVSGQNPAAAPALPEVTEEGPPPVDFDALHAALGDPLDYEELPSGPALEKLDEVDELFEQDQQEEEDAAAATPVPPVGGRPRVGESSGRSSATYASARPHTIPPTRSPVEDLNAPPVIVAVDDNATVPSAPPQMTVPIGAAPHLAPFPGQPIPTSPRGGAAAPQPPGPSHPSSGPHPAAAVGGPALSHTPQPFPVIQRSSAPQLTMRMPDRPVNPRRAKTNTIVVRQRGPSTKQKLVAFMAMLLLVTACGIAVIIWRKPKLLGLDPGGTPSASSATRGRTASTCRSRRRCTRPTCRTPSRR